MHPELIGIRGVEFKNTLSCVQRSWIHSHWQEILLGHNWSNGAGWVADTVRPEEVLKRDWQGNTARCCSFLGCSSLEFIHEVRNCRSGIRVARYEYCLPRASISYTAFMQRQISRPGEASRENTPVTLTQNVKQRRSDSGPQDDAWQIAACLAVAIILRKVCKLIVLMYLNSQAHTQVVESHITTIILWLLWRVIKPLKVHTFLKALCLTTGEKVWGVTLYFFWRYHGMESVMDDREEIFQIRQKLDRLYLTNILAHHLLIFLGFSNGTIQSLYQHIKT